MAVAVSGGGDSMALALLAQQWVTARHGRLLALTVDHALRPESAAEAAQVGRWLGARGIAHRSLRWLEAKPATGIQAAAREARYRLLARACREAAILHLLLAHHADDQAETVAMRHARGSGPTGLAAMPAVAEVAGLRLLRPLLGVPKRRLLATLEAVGQPWLEDPSNGDPRFARTALRLRPHFPARRWWRDGRREAQARTAREARLAAFLAAAACPHPLGWVRLDLERWRGLPDLLKHLALARLLTSVAGGVYPVRTAPLAHLVSTLERPSRGWRATAGGCILDVRRSGLRVSREPGRLRARANLAVGERVLWDRRFVVELLSAAEPAEVAPLDETGRMALPTDVRAQLRAAAVPAAAVAALPVVRDAAGRMACPLLACWGLIQPAAIRVEIVLGAVNPLAGPGFCGANVVSKARWLIYPEATEPAQCPERAGRPPVDWVPRLT